MDFLVSQSCIDLLPVLRLIRKGIIPLIQFGVPIILILFAMIDFAKMVIASKEDEIKTAQKLLIKRFIYAACIFFVVTVVSLVFNLIADTGGDEETAKAKTWWGCWNEAGK